MYRAGSGNCGRYYLINIGLFGYVCGHEFKIRIVECCGKERDAHIVFVRSDRRAAAAVRSANHAANTIFQAAFLSVVPCPTFTPSCHQSMRALA